MKNPSHIIFDFNRTLFDDDRFVTDLVEIFKSHGVTDEALLNSYASLKVEGAMWSPYRWIERAMGSVPEAIIRTIDAHLMQTASYIYPDVKSALATFSVPLSILSYGDAEVQKKKIAHSGIAHYFPEIVITKDAQKTSEFTRFSKTEHVVFVDDRGPIIDAVKSAHPAVTCVRIMRSGSAYNHEPSQFADKVISSLYDLKMML
jgi:FMN phosphatase YigB (HAD superfamily)